MAVKLVKKSLATKAKDTAMPSSAVTSEPIYKIYEVLKPAYTSGARNFPAKTIRVQGVNYEIKGKLLFIYDHNKQPVYTIEWASVEDIISIDDRKTQHLSVAEHHVAD